MNDRPLDRVLNAIRIATEEAAVRNGRSWKAICPAHDDRRPSLSVSEGDDGRVLLHCHAGCTTEAIIAALGLLQRDLFVTDSSDTAKTARNGPKRGVPSASKGQSRSRVFPTARDAIAATEKQHGPPAASWTYHNADGEPVSVVIRWSLPDGTKNIRPVSHNGAGWIVGAMPKPRPLYGLPELSKACRVYIVEGEPAAEALREIGVTATTSAGGSKAASATDWSPLAGHECVVWPDADEPGKAYADDVTRLIAGHTPAATLKRIEPTGLPKGGDAVDFIEARRAEGMTDTAIRVAIEQLAEAAIPIESVQVVARTTAYQPFPVRVLPEPVRSFIAQGAKALGCDPSFIALPLLSVLGSAIGATRRIELKRGWTEPAIIWTAIVGESGTLKTPAFKLVVKPIRDIESDRLKRHEEETAEYDTDILRYEKELAAWRRSKTANDDPPVKPQPPQAQRCVVSDPTVEAIAPILLANPRGLLLARDELAGWIASFDRYVGGKGGADATHWLSMHNGESILVDRKTGQPHTIYVPSASVSITGGVQPGILDRVLGREHRESGLLARLVLCMPPRRRKRWTEAIISPSTEAAIAAIVGRLYELEPDYDDKGDPRPRIVKLTPDGRAAWVAFYNEHAEEHVELTDDLCAAWSKLEGYAARLALVVHCVRAVADDSTLRSVDAVDDVSIDAGVTLSRWFGNEARRVYGVLDESEDDRERRRFADLIAAKGGSASVREWQRTRSHESAAASEAELAELVEAGFGAWQIPAQTGPGRPSSKRFVLTRQSDGTDTDNSLTGSARARVLSMSELSETDGDVPGAADVGDEWVDL